MRNIIELIHNTVDELSQLTHLGISQFEMDVKDMDEEIDKDLLGIEESNRANYSYTRSYNLNKNK